MPDNFIRQGESVAIQRIKQDVEEGYVATSYPGSFHYAPRWKEPGYEVGYVDGLDSGRSYVICYCSRF